MSNSHRVLGDSRSRLASSHSAFSRRDVLAGAGAIAGLAVAANASAQSGAGKDPHAGHGAKRYFDAKAAKSHPALFAATGECIASGQRCLSHCLETFRLGDTTMAECASAVDEMLHVCTAMSYLTVADSKHLRAMADVCIAVCDSCEKACREHEEHQAECRECADACAALIREAKKLRV